MNDHLPIIDELDSCNGYAEMADWLCACPLAIFAGYAADIELVCMAHDFEPGANYVRSIHAGLMATRTNARVPQAVTKAAAQHMKRRAIKLDVEARKHA
jgi:hypothetical protein